MSGYRKLGVQIRNNVVKYTFNSQSVVNSLHCMLCSARKIQTLADELDEVGHVIIVIV